MRLPVRMRQQSTRICFPHVFFSPSRLLPVAPSSGREEALRQKASLATALAPALARTRSICCLNANRTSLFKSLGPWPIASSPPLSSLPFTRMSSYVPVPQTSLSQDHCLDVSHRLLAKPKSSPAILEPIFL